MLMLKMADEAAHPEKKTEGKQFAPSMTRFLVGALNPPATAVGGVVGALTAPTRQDVTESAARGMLRAPAMTAGAGLGGLAGGALGGIGVGLAGINGLLGERSPQEQQQLLTAGMLAGGGTGALAGGYLGDRFARSQLGKPSWEDPSQKGSYGSLVGTSAAGAAFGTLRMALRLGMAVSRRGPYVPRPQPLLPKMPESPRQRPSPGYENPDRYVSQAAHKSAALLQMPNMVALSLQYFADQAAL